MESASLHSEAYNKVIQSSKAASNPITCPFTFPLYDTCSSWDSPADGFEYNSQFASNVTFNELGVITPLDEESINLNEFASDQVSISRASVA